MGMVSDRVTRTKIWSPLGHSSILLQLQMTLCLYDIKKHTLVPQDQRPSRAAESSLGLAIYCEAPQFAYSITIYALHFSPISHNDRVTTLTLHGTWYSKHTDYVLLTYRTTSVEPDAIRNWHFSLELRTHMDNTPDTIFAQSRAYIYICSKIRNSSIPSDARSNVI